MEYGIGPYGVNSYGVSYPDEEVVDCSVDLLRHLPPFYHDIREMVVLQGVLGSEVGGVLCTLYTSLNQMFIDTTDVELARWERIFALSVDINKSTEFRRERIRSKLRGAGTTTTQLITNVASSFANSEVKVIEYPKEHRFIVKFVGTKGIPANMKDLNIAIEEIKPAHLTFEFEYTYNAWNDVKHFEWSAVNKSTWEQLRTV